jgi:tetratricopeptide (TPR) repeat protein
MVAAVVVLAAGTAVRADRIRTAKGIGLQGEITGLGAEGLEIRTALGKQNVALDTIAKVEVDKVSALGDAEEAYAEGIGGKAPRAAEARRAYEALLRQRIPSWLRAFIQFRLFRLYADAGNVEEALDAYLAVGRHQPALAAGLKLPAPAEGARDVNSFDPEALDGQAMLKKVNEALKEAGRTPYGAELQSFRLRLVMLEGSPEEVLPLLEPLLASPDPKTRRMALLKRVEALLAGGKTDEAAKGLESAAGELGEEHAAEVAYWRGRIAQAQGRHLEAALEYMRLAILYPTKEAGRTAEALWRAGQAMEAAGAPRGEAIQVYREAEEKYAGTAGAEQAKRELARLGSG